MQEKVIAPNILGKIFGDIKLIEITNDSILVAKSSGDFITVNFSEISDIPTMVNGVFGSSLNLKDKENSYIFSFLKRSSVKAAFKTIEEKSIKNISSAINDANNIFIKKTTNEYLRDSSIGHIEKVVGVVLSNYLKSKARWQSKLSENELATLMIWEEFFPLSKGKHHLRETYESKRLSIRKSFFDRIESNPLTEQQRLSVIRNNDLNLVLAAAGTGKTSVMVAKALDLIESKVAKNDEILILAYNNAAAKELKERLTNRVMACGITEECTPTASTFHALGRKILKDCGISTYLSDFADDPKKLEMWVTKWLIEYIKSSPASLKNFIQLSYQPTNPFDFDSKEQYDAYVRDNEYRTLQGERVKGYQELIIANWLFLNSVEYEYEAPYIAKRRIEIGFDYKPDFHIKDTCIYLEHFGIDRSGNTRKDINRAEYNISIKNKRLLHAEYQTTLIETFHYDWTENNLENRLEMLINKSGIEIRQKSPEEIFKTLNELGYIEENAKRYLKCLQAIRVERLDKESTLLRLQEKKIVCAEEYADLLDALHSAYKNELENQKRIDFDDMIILSTNAITSSRFTPRWSHILVDEFQDISMARMGFLKALINYGPNPVLTVVGDDWQSIYRFSGGKLELTTRFEELIGSHSFTKLEKTFRYNNSIADTAGTFVMQNPEQYKKNVATHDIVDSSQVYLLDSKVGNENNLEERILQVLNTIKRNDPNGSVAILARYNYLIKNAREKINETSHKNIKYWTFHGSKGLESDYCILVGFFQGKTGFPNANKDEAVIEALLPNLDTFPHSEERRLLYVAITRAKKKAYLIADPMAPSEFINELLTPKYKLHITSKTFEDKYRQIFKCPICTDGYFKLISGKFGNFYSCSSGSVCTSKPRICDKCGSPSLDTASKSICNNHDCRNETVICDRCGRPMKLRDGKFGNFFGCTGYGIKDDQCKNTRRIYRTPKNA
jgi:DNA helicase-4